MADEVYKSPGVGQTPTPDVSGTYPTVAKSGKPGSNTTTAAPASGAKAIPSDPVRNYSPDASKYRLVDIKANDGTLDDRNLSYIKLVSDAVYKDLEGNPEKQYLDSLLHYLKEKYTKFIITSIQEDRREKAQIISTFGDYYAATFTGREPTVLVISGYLIFDYQTDDNLKSWYQAFVDAYDYYLRASRLAKWRASMRLYLADGYSYEGYMLGLSTSQQSDNDIVVPMNFSLLIKDKWATHPIVTVNPPVGKEESTQLPQKKEDLNKLLKELQAVLTLLESCKTRATKVTDPIVSKAATLATPAS